MSRFNTAERNDIVEKSQQCLWTDEGLTGFKYLTEDRKLSKDVISVFRLGYLPSDLNHKLAGRIIFPVYDASNHLVAISSRLVDGPTSLPVYWHERYEKGFYLYGMSIAKEYIRKWRFAIVVEGQIDTIQMHNHGMLNTVGLCGSMMTSTQFATIRRYCDEVIMLLDRDENGAGQKGTDRAIKDFGSHRFEFIPVFRDKVASISFPENIDPDEFLLKYGVSKLRSMIKSKLDEMRELRDY